MTGTESTEEIERPEWLRDLGRRIIGGFVFVILAFALVAALIVTSFDGQRRHDRQSDTDKGYVACLQSNDRSAGLRTMVHIAFEGNSQTPDLTGVPGFADLPPSVQQFFRTLAAESTARPNPADDPNSAESKILALFPPKDCESLFPDHTRGLTATSGQAPTTTSTSAP